MSPLQDPSLADKLIRTAVAAGNLTLRYFNAPRTMEKSAKVDGSPVTLADQEAEEIILADLARDFPDVPVIAEEAVSRGEVPAIESRFFLVDPLDGTKEFTGGSGEYTVNIALVEGARPVYGVVYAPALGELYITTGPETAAMAKVTVSDQVSAADIDLQPISTREPPSAGLTIVGSKSHGTAEGDAWVASLSTPVVDKRSIGSSLKFCLLARGEADIYPRFGPTMEWDTAAGQAVLEAAGGCVTTVEGAPFQYAKAGAGYKNPGFIAYGRPSLKTA